ncbi:Synaptic glycoprotein SC2 [Histomonas meleagridis]|uniref:Synaptic glycoprotein SC2 n=1 Tax=Histomonas meleagridis TaxID=135588 RepID=UPI003559F791|nr:Synaptic glycoprotein SC2 [Histomonas meleagridis]KAH0799797.1 Synaptic glycoprotein SC2 [Histomonas meleagridis]
MEKTLIWKEQHYKVELEKNARADELLKKAISITHLKANRINITFQVNGKRIPIDQSTLISEIPSDEFLIRDFGPQFSYKGVFILEYIGPFFIWPLTKIFLKSSPSMYLTIASLMWTFHFTKRLFETVMVHVFSHPTMPIFNLYKNCTFYWGFAIMISIAVVKKSSNPIELDYLHYASVVLFFVFEFLNAYCHLKLRSLRPKGSKAYYLPRGFLFDKITCPNYTAEIAGWFCFAAFTRVWIAFLFPIVGGAQMYIWATKKKARLVKEFPEAAQRGRILPFKSL